MFHSYAQYRSNDFGYHEVLTKVDQSSYIF